MARVMAPSPLSATVGTTASADLSAAVFRASSPDSAAARRDPPTTSSTPARRAVHPSANSRRRLTQLACAACVDPRPAPRTIERDPRHRRPDVHGRLPRRRAPDRTRPVAVDAAPSATGMEDARFVRFTDDDGVDHLLRDLHRVRRRGDQPATAADHRLSARSPPFTARRPRGGQQGDGAVPAARRRPVRRAVAVGPGVEHRRLLRGPGAGASRCRASSRRAAWEVVQLGNCGSPIETEAGWLVLTHGVGPMRTYSIGAHPARPRRSRRRSSAVCRQPLLSPTPAEQDGYVPNVVYSCGALLHGDTLVIPTGSATRRSASRPSRCPILLVALTE